MKVMIAGAGWIDILRVKLFAETRVAEIAAIRSSAMKKLGPGGQAFGVVGTPSWTLAGEAVALSLVSGFLASAAAKEGAKELRKAQNETIAMLNSEGEWFSVGDVTNISLGNPSSWIVVKEGLRFLHSGDEFVPCETAGGTVMLLKWGQVAAVMV